MRSGSGSWVRAGLAPRGCRAAQRPDDIARCLLQLSLGTHVTFDVRALFRQQGHQSGERQGVSPPNPSATPPRSTPHAPGFYQLTHDYLVPSLREWLTRKQKETRRGRAELKLAERSALWNAKPENRYLPSLTEWLSIRTVTASKHWTAPQRAMMSRATSVHGLRTGLVTALLLAVVFTGFISQCTISVRTDASGQRHYSGIWSNQGAASELRPAYAGFDLVEQPQWDVAVAPAATLADPLESFRQQLAQIEKLPAGKLDDPQVREARATANYQLGNLELALADLDFVMGQASSQPSSEVSVAASRRSVMSTMEANARQNQ